MGQFDTRILPRTKITPEIAQKMLIDQYKKVKCRRCGTVSLLGDLKPALFIERVDTGRFRPPAMGGNGWNFHCPACAETIYAPRW
jgi:phage tail sheath gpL-like